MTPFEGHTGLTLILTCNKMATLNTLILVNHPEVEFSGFSVVGLIIFASQAVRLKWGS